MDIRIENDDAMLPVKQLSALLGVSALTLYRWREGGNGPPFVRLSPGRIGYPVGAYRKWVAAQTTESPAVAGNVRGV